MPEDATNEGWIQLLEEMEAMAEELNADGWETLTIASGETAPVTAEEGYTDRHGYSYVIPGDDAETFEELFELGGFPETEIYQATSRTHLFLLTVFLDPPTETAILLAGLLETAGLSDVCQISEEVGKMYSHICKVDGTHLGSFEHEQPELFFPSNARQE